MDAWTLPNHHAFVAWTVHFEYNGTMLAFLLDIVEVLESHTSMVLAGAFQKMLETFGLQDQVCLVASHYAFKLIKSSDLHCKC
jgi:hypothetical protein